MDSRTTTTATHDRLDAMFQNITIDKAEQNRCVTSEKTLDSHDVLDESNRPLQGTEISVPLTTPDNDYDSDPLPATISVTLPRELVERILLLLDAESMLNCRLVNREFNEIIETSTRLQYILACEVAGVIDNPRSPLSYAERLEALLKREQAWQKLKPALEMTIDGINQTASSICFSTEGIYFLSDNNLKDLNYCHLTSFPQENPQWNRILGHGPAVGWSGILVNFVAALYEHDLIVNLISVEIGNQADTVQRHSLNLVFLKFSTGEYHPLARHPQIHVQISPEVEPWVVSRIVGDHLALVVHSDDGTFSDKLFIFDWKTGRKLLQQESSENAYSGLAFVSPELLVVPNHVLSHIEVWHLPLHQLSPPIQILSLKMPAVSPEYFLVDFDCYGEPNPFLHSVPYLPPRPFFSSPEDSIIVAKLRMSSNSRRDASYTLIMHRRALLDTIQIWTSPSPLGKQEKLPTWLTNEVTVHRIADPEGVSVELDVRSKWVSTMPNPTRSSSRSPPTSHVSADPGGSPVSSESSTNLSTSRYTFPQVPWAKWGPPISRWLQSNDTQARWVAVSNGQRYAFSNPNLGDPTKLMVSVADFNPYNVRRNAEMTTRFRSGKGKSNGRNGNNEEGKEEEGEKEFEILDHKGVFSEEVYMGLKCVVYHAPDEYDFHLVLMDEQRLLGVKLNRDGLIDSIKVLYIG